MRKNYLGLLATTLSAIVFVVQPVSADHGPPARQIRVSGHAEVRATPDRARVSVRVVTRSATAREAAESNAVDSDKVVAALKKFVGSGGQVSTDGYQLNAEYEYRKPPGTRHLSGYVASNRVTAVTDDLRAVGRLIDTAVVQGANEIEGVGFFLADETGARRQATLEAGRRARAEAATVAESLGVGLGALLEASTTNAPVVVPRLMAHQGRAMAMEAAPSTPIEPGDVRVGATVSAVFEVQ